MPRTRMRHGRASIRTFTWPFALVVTLACAFATGHAYADPRPTPHRATERIHDRGRYPNDLLVAPESDAEGGGAAGQAPIPIFGGRGAPSAPPDPPAPPPDWMPDFEMPAWLGALFDLLGAFGYVVLFVAIALIVALFVWLLFRMRKPIPNEVGPKKLGPAPAAAALAADPLLAMPELSHDELARLGRFREAVHALLVGALLSTGWAPEGRGRGLTAREIVRAYANTAPPREPLDSLLGVTERVWFGGRDATRETYESALASYRLFVPGGGGAS